MSKLNFINIKARRGHIGLIGALVIFVLLLLFAGGLSIQMKKADDDKKKSDDKKTNGLSYPDSEGKMVIMDPRDVSEFKDNVGSLQTGQNKLVANFGNISRTPICTDKDDGENRGMLARYLARVYNGTKERDILRLTTQQMITFIKGCEWIYVVPAKQLGNTLTTYFNSKRRLAPAESFYEGSVQANNEYSPYGGIANITTNWNADRNQAYLFQTQMAKGSKKGPKAQWWGNYLFTDPTRASLRRGMMNTPQNNPKFFDKMFGYGGIPPNKLFEVGILPIDSPFAKTGTIQGVLGLPNKCNPAFNDTCVMADDQSGKRKLYPKNAYSYFCPGSGMFLNSGPPIKEDGKGGCGYMYNFVDGLLNCPKSFYNDKKSKNKLTGYGGVESDAYSALFSKRLSNGAPDHEVGIMKLIIYLHRKSILSPGALELMKKRVTNPDPNSRDSGPLTRNDINGIRNFYKKRGYKNYKSIQLGNTNWLQDVLDDPLSSTNLQVRLPKWPRDSPDSPYERMEEEFKKTGGLGLGGLLSPLDVGGPPKSILGNARTACSQLAALMGVWKSPPPGKLMDQANGPGPLDIFYSYGLMTADGNTTLSKCPFVDKRKYAMGWINGRWYGYPPEDKYNEQDALAPPSSYENFEYPSDAWENENEMDQDEMDQDEITTGYSQGRGRRGSRDRRGSRRRRRYTPRGTSGQYMTATDSDDPKKSTYPGDANCASRIGATYTRVQGNSKFRGGGRFTKGGKNGVPGKKELRDERWTGNWFMPTKDNPLIYYGMPDKKGNREVIYKTWYGKPLQMDFSSALKLMGMMYSCDDTGWLEGYTEWPFGAQFSYAADLGPLKKANGQSFLDQFGAYSLHYTCTATSLSKRGLVSPAYDYEVLVTIPDPKVQTLACFCKTYMKSVNLLQDNGKYLTEYLNPARGAIGGLMPPEAGREYDGSMGLSNFTAAYTHDDLADKDIKDIERKYPGLRGTTPECNLRNFRTNDSDCFYATFDANKDNMVTGMSNNLEPLKCTDDMKRR